LPWRWLEPGVAGRAALELLGYGGRDWGVVVVFAVVYRGMFLGGLPRLKLDRSGVALLGAIAVLAVRGVLPALVWAWLH
jgi:hypothetical protein